MRVIKEGFLYQVTFMPKLFPVNCYFIEEEDGLTLIDAALPISAKPILQAAQQIGKPIKRIVLTHAHGDHIGALDQLKDQLQVPFIFQRGIPGCWLEILLLIHRNPNRRYAAESLKRLKRRQMYFYKMGNKSDL
jgi:glyoxylase-like metal-dependent hydrolase (beta-lactamase superfamily II)